MELGVVLELEAAAGNVADLARHAEAIGYDAMFFPEHIATPVEYSTYYRWGNEGKLPEHYNRWPDPYICATVAASVTSRIRVGTGISLLPQRDPIVLAKQIATMDLYAGGRTMFAFGAGWLREEMALFGTDFDTRWQRWCESVDAMKAMWSERHARFDGDIIRFPPLRSEPKPVQPGGPKVLVGVHRPSRAFPMVVDHADGWFPLFSEGEDGMESVSGTQLFVDDIAKLRRMAEDKGRNPAAIEVVPVMMPQNGDITERTMAALHGAGVRLIMVTSGEEKGVISSPERGLRWLDKFAFLAERAHQFG